MNATPSESVRLSNQGLSWQTCFAYASPVMGLAWLIAPLAIVQGIYAKYYGISLGAIAAVVLAGRLFDGVTDPLIGAWSDHHARQRGSRKPFIAVGGVLFAVAAYVLYSPPEQVSLVYFTVAYLSLYLAFTICDIPHQSWGSELARQGTDKTRLFGVRLALAYTGQVAFYAVPFLPWFDSRAITPETLRVSVLLAIVVFLPSLWWSLRSVTAAPSSAPASSITSPAKRVRLWAIWGDLWRNRPFVLFALAYTLYAIGSGMWYGLVFILVDIYLGMGEYFAQMFLVAFVIGTAAAPLWHSVALFTGKKALWFGAIVVMMGCYLYTGLLRPGETGVMTLWVLKSVQTLAYTCIGVVTPALLSEICDYGHWKSGEQKTGSYFAVFGLVGKVSVAVAMALGLAIAGWFGFDAQATEQTAEAEEGLRLAMVWVPLFFSAVALVLIAKLPLTERRHAVIQRRLA